MPFTLPPWNLPGFLTHLSWYLVDGLFLLAGFHAKGQRSKSLWSQLWHCSLQLAVKWSQEGTVAPICWKRGLEPVCVFVHVNSFPTYGPKFSFWIHYWAVKYVTRFQMYWPLRHLVVSCKLWLFSISWAKSLSAVQFPFKISEKTVVEFSNTELVCGCLTFLTSGPLGQAYSHISESDSHLKTGDSITCHW